MAYCRNCGRFIPDDANFCMYCGSPAKNAPSISKDTSDDHSRRRQEFAGTVVKCPNCGAEIPSFTAICPSCGHEINSADVPEALEEFADQIRSCDMAIASSASAPKRGWKSWGGWKKFGWVILNTFTLCIPLVLYFLLPVIGIGGTASLTPMERRKASIISDFSFPNDRENILEALFYIKAQSDMLASDKADRNTLTWIRIWKSKAKQLYEKAEIMFPGDEISSRTYNSILADERKVRRSLSMRLVLAIFIVVMLLALLSLNSTGSKSSSRNKDKDVSAAQSTNITMYPSISADTTTDESEGIYAYHIRNYIGRNLKSIGQVVGETERVTERYGDGTINIVAVTEKGNYVSVANRDKYVVVGQNLPVGTNITIVHERNNLGMPYDSLVLYQSYDEIVLYVAPVGTASSYTPEYTQPLPTLDRHTYHIKDYVGRNAASIGVLSGSSRVDRYGDGRLRVVFSSHDGTYVNPEDLNDLQRYVVTAQDIAPGMGLELTYEKNNLGVEYDSLIDSQNYEEINLQVALVDD